MMRPPERPCLALLKGHVDLLLVTATQVETGAVLNAFRGGPEVEQCNGWRNLYWDIGVLNGCGVVLVQSGMAGSGGISGSHNTVSDAIMELQPFRIILVGIAYGLQDSDQQLGDVLVSTHLYDFAPRRIGDTTIPRGPTVPASTELINLMRAAAQSWRTRPHFGLIVSAPTIVDNDEYRAAILREEPEAVGGEMEGAGVYAASEWFKTPWIIVKAISDWGRHKKAGEVPNQGLAAQNAAEFVRHAVDNGDFGPDPRRTQEPPPRAPEPQSRARIFSEGPIEALGLAPDVRAAEGSADPAAAAETWRTVASALSKANLEPFATKYRLREAQALTESGQHARAFDVLFGLASDALDRGLVDPPPQALDLLSKMPEPTNVQDSRLAGMRGFVEWFADSQAGLSKMESAVTSLREAKDPFATKVLAWALEAALTDEQFEVAVRLLAPAPPAADAVSLDQLRVELARADLAQSWTQLLGPYGSTQLGSEFRGLILSRFARAAAWSAKPEDAIDAYREALPILAARGLVGDLDEALMSLWIVHQAYGPWEEGQQYLELARSVTSGPRLLYDAPSILERALRHLHERQYAQAQAQLRLYLLQARASGYLRPEMQARSFLGDLYALVNEPAPAAANYVRAGSASRAAEEALKVAAEMEYPADLQLETPWVLASSLAVMGAQGDLVSPATANKLLPRVLDLTKGVRQGPYQPSVAKHAVDALAGVALQLSPDGAAAALDGVRPLIPRPPNSYRPTDESMLKIIATIHASQPSLRDRTTGDLIECLGEPDLAPATASVIGDLLQQDPRLAAKVMSAADKGNTAAIDALDRTGIDHPAAVAEARRLADELLAFGLQDRPPGEWSALSGLERTAAMAKHLPRAQRTRLADAFIALAENPEEWSINRSSALFGLYNLADYVTAAYREDLFARMIRLTTPDLQVSSIDRTAQETQHPLSRFKINFDIGAVQHAALISCARYATKTRQVAQFRSLIMTWLVSPQEEELAAAAHAIAGLKPRLRTTLGLNLSQLVAHPSVQIRTLAAFLWAQDPQVPELGEALAKDANRSVRVALATSLNLLEEQLPRVASMIREVLLADLSAAVRFAAVHRYRPPSLSA